MFAKFACVLCVCSSCFLQALDQHAARQFERLSTTNAGGLYNFPQEIRNRRVGPVVQEVKISDDGIMSISLTFSCSQDGKSGRKKKARAFKQFSLSDFAAETGKFVEVNKHTNTMTIFDHGIGWTLVFQSPEALEQATTVFKSVVRSVRPTASETNFLPSNVAKEAGYRTLIAVPRCQTVEDSFQLLSLPDQSAKIFFFLSRYDSSQVDAILAESKNASPLYIFDLSVIDQAVFFTLPFFDSTKFSPCDIEDERIQSALSDDINALRHAFSQKYVGIRFISLPKNLVPLKVLGRWNDCHWVKKYSAKLVGHSIPCEEITPLFDAPEAPQGTVMSWLMGNQESSDDVLRYFFYAPERLDIGMLVREYPELGRLLQEKSRYKNDASIEKMIELFLQDHLLEKKMPQDQRVVLKVALFAHQLGAPFGPDSELVYNSWPFALTLSEKLGFSENQKNMLEALISATPPLGKPPKLPDACSLLQHESIVAKSSGLSLHDWLQLKLVFLKITAQHLRTFASYMSYLQSFEKLVPQLHQIDPPSGRSAFSGSYPTRRLFSSYLWEVRDPQHRDGLSLLRRRGKYEHMLLDHPHSPWKGRFWDWLEKETVKEPLSPGVYLSSEERAKLLARFENGRLTMPALPNTEGEVEMMYVVDSAGNMYIGQKRDGKGKDETSFNHAGFFGGGPVAAAGKILFIDGHVSAINDHSGHYRPGVCEMKIAAQVLERLGVPLDTVSIYIGAGAGRKKQLWKSAHQFLHSEPNAYPASDDDEQSLA
jgi:hypothetical protein